MGMAAAFLSITIIAFCRILAREMAKQLRTHRRKNLIHHIDSCINLLKIPQIIVLIQTYLLSPILSDSTDVVAGSSEKKYRRWEPAPNTI